jgi:hypothetical protein
MTSDNDDRHSKQVDAWIAKNTDGIPNVKLVLLFGEAIQAIRKRALATLSEVTFDAVFDRVLWTSRKQFPFLSELKMEPDLSVEGLVEQSDDLTSDQLKGAFRFLLISLLALLGNLTADILTKPLHRELAKVTIDRLPSKPKTAPRSLRSIKGGTDEGNL